MRGLSKLAKNPLTWILLLCGIGLIFVIIWAVKKSR